jgi:hypothetical protein
MPTLLTAALWVGWEQVCRQTFGKERAKLYDALKAAGASYALCFAAANCYGAEVE